MHRRLTALALAPLAAGSMLAATLPAAAQAGVPAARTAAVQQQRTGSLTQAVTGTVNDVATTGTLTITHFVHQGSQVLAVGDLVLGGTDLGTVQVPVDVTDPPGTCSILHLDLGPLDLTLLGLHVHLNEVVLDITAQSGPGNLLGNLLCAVAHLLDNGSTTALTALLNQVLAAL